MKPLTQLIWLFLAVMGFAGAALGEEEWSTERIDCPHWIVWVGERGLGLDESGNPRLAYGGWDGLFYAHQDGPIWRVESVDGLPGLQNTSATLSRGPQGEPWLFFSGDETPGPSEYYLGYACRSPEGWRVGIVDSVGNTGYWPCAQRDTEGRVHIVSHQHGQDWTLASLRYATLDQETWVTDTIQGVVDPGSSFSMGLDSYNYPHLAYLDDAQNRLMYAYYDETCWDSRVVDATGLVGRHNSIALDQSDRPHISYYDELMRDLKFARLVGTTWLIEVVDSTGCVGRYTSLALDGEGFPHISYQDETTPALKHAVKRDGIWKIEVVVAGAMPIGTSLALGDSEAVCIGFYDLESNLVRFARQVGETWTIDPVDRSGCIGDNLSLAVDAGSEPVVAYRDEISTDLRCARQDRDGWAIEVVDAVGDVGNNPGVGIGPTGALHISYCDWGNKDLKHAWHDGSEWQIETVDEGGSVGRYTSLAVDGSGAPCISYYDESNDALKYARRGAGGWEIEQAATAGGRYTSVALDQTGMPHISHYDLSWQDLKHTYKSGAVWTTEAVDKPGNVGSCSSIAVDAAGRPHISYLEIIPSTCPILAWVKHAYRGETGWEIEVVEQSIGYSNTSIRLDNAGYPCVAFSGVEAGLRYAWRDENGWRIEIADTSEGAGYCPSLGIGPDGEIHIAHTDRDRYDLLYTHSTGVGAEGPKPRPADARVLSISPNPARDRVSVVYSGGEPDQVILRIYDLVGRLVAGPGSDEASSGTLAVDWRIEESDARPGVYVIRVESEDGKIHDQRKVVVVR